MLPSFPGSTVPCLYECLSQVSSAVANILQLQQHQDAVADKAAEPQTLPACSFGLNRTLPVGTQTIASRLVPA